MNILPDKKYKHSLHFSANRHLSLREGTQKCKCSSSAPVTQTSRNQSAKPGTQPLLWRQNLGSPRDPSVTLCSSLWKPERDEGCGSKKKEIQKPPMAKANAKKQGLSTSHLRQWEQKGACICSGVLALASRQGKWWERETSTHNTTPVPATLSLSLPNSWGSLAAFHQHLGNAPSATLQEQRRSLGASEGEAPVCVSRCNSKAACSRQGTAQESLSEVSIALGCNFLACSARLGHQLSNCTEMTGKLSEFHYWHILFKDF